MPSVAAIVLPSLAVLLKGIFARTLYTVHGFLCVWRLTDVKSDPTYWLATVPVLLLPIEMVITVAVNKTKGEWKWFCPSVFLCLATSVSAIYILEIELMNQRIDYTETKNLTSCDVESGDVHTNSTRLSDIHGLRIPLSLRDDYWVLALEQFLVCMIIVGRWFLPKGDMTREQLSTLLLVYIGIASDILEFVREGLKEPEVKCHATLVYVILSIWSVSMLQFAVVLTASGERNDIKTKRCCPWNAEIREILITSFMQDAPFLIVRLVLLIHYEVVSNMMLFFTCKNTVMLMLQSYRLIVIIAEERKSVTPANGDVEDTNRDMALEDLVTD